MGMLDIMPDDDNLHIGSRMFGGVHMDNNFINRKDRIIASAIEIISESGLESLNTKTLAMKENMSESLLYRYFGSIDEVLVEVVETHSKFDPGMLATVEAKDISHIEKVVEFLRLLASYYANYQDMAAIVLNYESFLHNVNTRDKMTECATTRYNFLRKEFEASIADGEISDVFTPDELCLMVTGTILRDTLNRRMSINPLSSEQLMENWLRKLLDLIVIKK